jgi:3',5'-cyclic AMP phosphodiesterase CpdA
MKFHLSNCIAALLLAITVSGCECHNPMSVDDRFLEKDSLADFAAPAVGNVDNFSFLVIADTHYGWTPYEFFSFIESNRLAWGIDFVVILGDISEAGLKTQLDIAKSDTIKTTIPVYPVIGNHDIFASGWDRYKYVFGRSVYTFTITGLKTNRFIFLDSASGTLGSHQRSWLESILAQPTTGKKIIFTHLSPTDDDIQSFTEYSYPQERYYLFDLFEKNSVDYYLCGHLHLNDDKTIRGVRYMVIKNLSEGIAPGTLLKININNGVITATYL